VFNIISQKDKNMLTVSQQFAIFFVGGEPTQEKEVKQIGQ
jgi:hypothetical protein